MKIEEARKYQKKSFDDRWKIRESKSHDYATEDILSNFKRRALLFDILEIDITTPHGVALGDAVLKVDRICNLLFRRKDKPKHESVKDSIIDLKNYIDLAEECLIDGEIIDV